ncbi:MAG: serine hydrolase domain-containing protein [Aggregatilineales bacterium]
MTSFEIIDSLIHSALKTTAPSIALAVYHHGEIFAERAYGYLDPETQRQPVLNSTQFDLASVTKLFTTTAFLMQVTAGKAKIDDKVVSVLPEFAKYGERDIEGGQNPHTLERETNTLDGTVDPSQVTFRHLLTHTSGLAPWRDLFLTVGDLPPAPETGETVNHQERLTKALDLIATYPYVSNLGEKVNYSDLGLITLGAAVARIEHKATLADVIYERVSPAVTYNPPIPEKCPPTEYDERWRKRRCQGEVHDESACSLGGIAGHAGLFGSADQVAQLGLRWLYALDGNDPQLSQDIAKEAITNHREDRGLGWVLRSSEGSSSGQYFSENSFGHTGFTGTTLWVDPHRQLVVALMTNRVYYGRESLEILTFRKKLHDAVVLWIDTL